MNGFLVSFVWFWSSWTSGWEGRGIGCCWKGFWSSVSREHQTILDRCCLGLNYFCGCLQFFTFFLDNSKKILVSFCIYLWLLICLQVIILYHAIYKLEIMMKGKHVQHLHSNNDADHKVININIIDLRYVRALQAIFFIKRERIWWMYLVISTSLKCFISPNFSFGIGLNRITPCI